MLNDMDTRTIQAITAEHVMDRDCLIVPQHMLMRDVVRLLRRKRTRAAAIVDDAGRCIGVLQTADVFRWVDADCPSVVVSSGLDCPFLNRGRLLNGDHAKMCTLAHGSCRFQLEQPTTGGRHTDVCTRHRAKIPFGPAMRYMRTDIVRIRRHSPLSDLMRLIADTRVEAIIVLDDFDRPTGIVTARDILIALAEALCDLTAARTQPTAAHKPQ